MAHPQQKAYCSAVKARFPQYFKGVLALDIGSLDLNGNNQYLFDSDCQYLGIDVAQGRNVDIVSPGHLLGMPSSTFDIIVSTECLEHDRHWEQTLNEAVRMLRPGGMLLMTCATTGRPEHGTRRTTPHDAPLLASVDDEWADYYRNLDEQDVRAALDVPELFQMIEFSVNEETHDLYCVAIKHGVFEHRLDRSIQIATHPVRIQEADLRAQLQSACEALQQTQAGMSSLTQSLAELREQVAREQAEKEQLVKRQLEQTSSLKNELTELRTSIGAAIDERNAAVCQIGAMRASVSWRLTAPVRFVGHLVQGNYALAAHGMAQIATLLPQSITSPARRVHDWALKLTGGRTNSNTNFPAIAALVAERCERTCTALSVDPMCPPAPHEWPTIDIGIVTFNSKRWIEGFVNSLLAVDYPKDKVTIRFVDNSSTDGTEEALQAVAPKLTAAGLKVEILSRPNNGFGAGHNVAIQAGCAPFCLVTNIDLTFEPDSLRRVVAMAMADIPQAAAWELRQKPYEHPKFYDPITGTTNWNAHACVLLRRSAVDAVAGYDETLFMYGEDVELSYRLRRAGHLLRYCPTAVVWHFSYEASEQVKPLQYIGSTFGNLFLRLKYGNLTDMLVVPFMALRLLFAPQAYPGSRRQVAKSLLRLIAVAPKALLARRESNVYFPFRTWDYELIRDGAFIEQQPLPNEQPLVSIITRTYRGRELYLRQALMSAAHQTWSNVEHIVVEDGDDTMRSLCEEVASVTGRTIRFIAEGKHGRSKAGNTGLAAASGRWCVFLDDDDFLFADHVEVLANALLAEPNAVASYSLAWEAITDTTELAQGSYLETTHRLPPALRQNFDFEVLLHHNYFPIQAVLFERQLFTERGGFDEDMDALEDWTLWIRYAWNHRFVFVPKVTSLFRTPADQAKTQERAAAFDIAYPLALTRANACINAYRQSDHKVELASNEDSVAPITAPKTTGSESVVLK